MVETLRFTRGNLPHWLVADHAYFVTIRLAGTISRQVITELQAERDISLRRLARTRRSGPNSRDGSFFMWNVACTLWTTPATGSPDPECPRSYLLILTGLRSSADGKCMPSRSCRITCTFFCATMWGEVRNCSGISVSTRTTWQGRPIAC